MFGYVMTRISAEKILDWAGKSWEEAFDARLFQGYKYEYLDCVVVNLELLHHHQPPNGIGLESHLRRLTEQPRCYRTTSSTKWTRLYTSCRVADARHSASGHAWPTETLGM